MGLPDLNDFKAIEQWEKANLTLEERQRREVNRRIEDLQERNCLNPGEKIELEMLLSKKWSGI